MKGPELLYFQAVWKRAFAAPDGLTIRFPSMAGANRARMQLYNAVKEQKAGRDFTDIELLHAAEQLEICWVYDKAGNKEPAIRIQRRANSDMMAGLVAAMGHGPEGYVDPEVKAMEERLFKELDTLGPKAEDATPKEGEHQPNPFYGKRS